MAEEKKISKGIFNWTMLAIVIVGIILVNIIGSFLYKRFDMTEDQRYSLSEGTINFLSDKNNFENRLSLKIYLEGALPAEIKHFRNAIEDKLKEFKMFAGDRIEFQFIDPNVGTDAEQQSLFNSLYAAGKGIVPMEVVYMKDGSQSKIMVWPGAVIDYGGSTVQNIQFLPGTPVGKPYNLNELTNMIDNSINNLEYILISSLRRATQEHKPRIGFLQGHGELTFAQTQRARSLIAPYYSIADVEIKDSLAALNDIDGLIIARPTRKFNERELYILDQFVMRGGRLMCLLDALIINEDSLNTNGQTHTVRNTTGLESMLFDYGLKLNENYVVDANCVAKPVPFAKESLIPWFFHILASTTKHPISRNLEPVSLNFASEIQFVGNSEIVLTPILTSSTNSNVTGLAPLVNLAMPLNYGKNPELIGNIHDEINKRCLAGLAEGKFVSSFKNRIVDEFAKNPIVAYKEESVVEGKVFLIGNGRFIANDYDSMPSRDGKGYMYRPTEFNNLRMDPELAQIGIPMYYGNQEFFQNMVDYMMGDNSVLDIRSRQIDIHNIDKAKIAADSDFYKLINLLVPILFILVFAFVMGYLRKRRYVQK